VNLVPHNRCHTRGATIVGEFVAGEIAGPTAVPAGAHVPAGWRLRGIAADVLRDVDAASRRLDGFRAESD